MIHNAKNSRLCPKRIIILFALFCLEFTFQQLSNVVCKRIKQKKKKFAWRNSGKHFSLSCTKIFSVILKVACCLPGVVEDDDDSPFGALEKVDI